MRIKPQYFLLLVLIFARVFFAPVWLSVRNVQPEQVNDIFSHFTLRKRRSSKSGDKISNQIAFSEAIEVKTTLPPKKSFSLKRVFTLPVFSWLRKTKSNKNPYFVSFHLPDDLFLRHSTLRI